MCTARCRFRPPSTPNEPRGRGAAALLPRPLRPDAVPLATTACSPCLHPGIGWGGPKRSRGWGIAHEQAGVTEKEAVQRTLEFHGNVHLLAPVQAS